MRSTVFILLIVCMAEIHAFKTGKSTVSMLRIVHYICARESGVSEQAVKDCRRGIFADDRKLKCYMKCMLTRIRAMDEEGNIDADHLIGMIPEDFMELAASMIRPCKPVKGADLCETAFLNNKCWYNQDPESYYLP